MKEEKLGNIALDVIKGGLFFGSLGPILSAIFIVILPFVFLPLIGDVFDTRSPINGVDLFGMSLFILIGAYMVGGVPAILTGLVAGLIRPLLIKKRYCIMVGFVGLFISAMWLGFFFEEVELVNGFTLFVGGLPCFIGGVVCGFIFRNRPSNA